MKIKQTKKYFNIFKQRVIYNYKIKTNILLINKYILTSNYNKFIDRNKFNTSIKRKKIILLTINKKFFLKKYLEVLNESYKMKLIDNKVDDYYKTKRKKNFLNILKKNYQNSIKYNILSSIFN